MDDGLTWDGTAAAISVLGGALVFAFGDICNGTTKTILVERLTVSTP
jgi:hypothetical protein